jgi:hypothetical protein
VRGLAPAEIGGLSQLRDFRKRWQAGRARRFRRCD